MKTDARHEAIRLRTERQLSITVIAKKLSVSKASVSLWVRDHPLDPDEVKRRRGHLVGVDWGEVQRQYDAGALPCVLRRSFRFGRWSWLNAARKGLIVLKPRSVELATLLVRGKVASTSYLKRRLIREGVLKNECSECELAPMWNGRRLVLQLDHRNGDSEDNRRENLRLLCPNCHSQTDTYAGKNKRDVA